MRRSCPPTELSECIELGWFSKQGSLRRNWKHRFFVLDGLRLKYFKASTMGVDGIRRPINEKGAVAISGWREAPGRLRCVLVSGRPRSLLIQAEGEAQLIALTSALDAALTQDAAGGLPSRLGYVPTAPGRSTDYERAPVRRLSNLPESAESKPADPDLVTDTEGGEDGGEERVMIERGTGKAAVNGAARVSSRTVAVEAADEAAEGAAEETEAEAAVGPATVASGSAAAFQALGSVADTDGPPVTIEDAKTAVEKVAGARWPRRRETVEATGAATAVAKEAATEAAVEVADEATQVTAAEAAAAATPCADSAAAQPESPPQGVGVGPLAEDAMAAPSEFARLRGVRRLTLDDFSVERVLGRGSFGTVSLVTAKPSGKIYALKSLNKRQLIATYQVEATVTERDILRGAVGHPFIVRLHAAFTSEYHLHFILDYHAGGDLQARLSESRTLPPSDVALYAAELALALGFLHDACGVIYRDIKPDNVLLDATGHSVLADFGLSKLATAGRSFCGTADYIAPEVVSGCGHDQAVDWWGLGVLLHELLLGETPFAGRSLVQTQRNILKDTPLPPVKLCAIEPAAAAFIGALVVRDPFARLGHGAAGTVSVLGHAYLAHLNLERVRGRGYAPLWAPPAGGVQRTVRDSLGDLCPALPPDDFDEDLPGSRGSSEDDLENGSPLPPVLHERFGAFSFVH